MEETSGNLGDLQMLRGNLQLLAEIQVNVPDQSSWISERGSLRSFGSTDLRSCKGQVHTDLY